MNKHTELLKKIEGLTPDESSLEHWKCDGEPEKDGNTTKEYFGEFCTPDQIPQLQSLATDYERLVKAAGDFMEAVQRGVTNREFDDKLTALRAALEGK